MRRYVSSPTPEQLDALRIFAKANGRTWKAALNHCWMTGNYRDTPGTDRSGVLQGIRNQFGPSWLAFFETRRLGPL